MSFYTYIAQITDHSALIIIQHATSSFDVNCSAIGFPIPKIDWKFSDASIESNLLHTVLHEHPSHTDLLVVSTLKFHELSISQEGAYSCCAGDDCVTFDISVQGMYV